ncbi:MAG: hypothetical protein AAF961_13625, partial [Planctomycetota bacterium]
MLWEIDVHPVKGLPDLDAVGVREAAVALGIADDLQVASSRAYLLEGGDLDLPSVERLAHELFADPVAEEYVAAHVG